MSRDEGTPDTDTLNRDCAPLYGLVANVGPVCAGKGESLEAPRYPLCSGRA